MRRLMTAKTEIADLDRQIRVAEVQTVDSAQRFMEAEGEIIQTLMDWQAARDAMGKRGSQSTTPIRFASA